VAGVRESGSHLSVLFHRPGQGGGWAAEFRGSLRGGGGIGSKGGVSGGDGARAFRGVGASWPEEASVGGQRQGAAASPGARSRRERCCLAAEAGATPAPIALPGTPATRPGQSSRQRRLGRLLAHGSGSAGHVRELSFSDLSGGAAVFAAEIHGGCGAKVLRRGGGRDPSVRDRRALKLNRALRWARSRSMWSLPWATSNAAGGSPGRSPGRLLVRGWRAGVGGGGA
jgi:hypothetical protein